MCTGTSVPRLAYIFVSHKVQVTTFQKYRLWVWLLLACLVFTCPKQLEGWPFPVNQSSSK